MPDRRRFPSALAWTALTAASVIVAAAIVADTIRTTVSLHSALPWFDDWNTINLFRDWSLGNISALAALSSQFGEHRPLVPRLVFFADDLFLKGRGWLELGAILLVQAGHAALFAAVLAGAKSRGGGRWAVACLVAALMFSLKQAPNFSSSFQLQFVGVFATATLAFVLFGRAAARAEAGLPMGASLAGSMVAAAVSTFCMANGLICGLVLVVLTAVAGLRARVLAVCAIVWLALAVLYLQDYHAASDHTRLSDALRHPLTLALYAATYLGNLAGRANPEGAAALGLLGIAATAAAAALVARGTVERRAGLPLLGVMLFCAATAIVTATGRLNSGIGQALEERYVTGSVTFWSAHLCFWWVAAPARLPRLVLMASGVWLAVVIVAAQAPAKAELYRQKLDQDDAGDLLLLGLEDRAAILRTAWDPETVRNDVGFMRDAAISVFGGRDAELLGRPLAETGRIAEPQTCTGDIATASSDPALGENGVRVDGQGTDAARRRRLRRVLLVDRTGRIVGLAVSGVPGGKPADWRGYAIAPAGSVLTAFGAVGDDRFCRLGAATVTVAQAAGAGRQRPQ